MSSHQVRRGQRLGLVSVVVGERCDCHASTDCYSLWASCLWTRVSRSFPILRRVAYQDGSLEEVALGLAEGIVHTAEVVVSVMRQSSSIQLCSEV
jgi:hypothetical protein